VAAQYLEKVERVSQNREYLVVNGVYEGTPVTVMSTGMGGVSVAIGVEELARCGVRYGIRIGSAGALQPSLRLGDLVIAEGAVRDEGTTLAYQPLSVPAIPSPEVYQALLYAARQREFPYSSGLVRSHDSFYRDDEESVSRQWHRRGVLAAEMETAALLIVGRLRGVRTGSILNVVVEYGEDTEVGIRSLVQAEERRKEGEAREILVALDALHQLHIAETP
jgi:uridine phosphorylase